MLPKVSHNRFAVTLPSNGKEIEMRPFLVKEEKILLMALESKSESEIVDAVQNILQSTVLTDGIEVIKLAAFDVDWMFLQLRKKSVGESVEIQLRHSNQSECKKLTPVLINLDTVEIKRDPEHTNKIRINDDIGVEMRYPNHAMIKNMPNNKVEAMFYTIYTNIKSIFTKDEIFTDFSEKEIKEWIGELSETQLKKIMKFFETSPIIEHDIEFTCASCNKTEKITLRGLKDFFI